MFKGRKNAKTSITNKGIDISLLFELATTHALQSPPKDQQKIFKATFKKLNNWASSLVIDPI